MTCENGAELQLSRRHSLFRIEAVDAGKSLERQAIDANREKGMVKAVK